MTKLTCITTVYNDGPALWQAVNSVLNQSFEDYQFILVDDGSGPDTRAILDQIDDPRVLHIRQANDGLSGARNKALEQVTGDYVCFLDADDTRPPWAFAEIAAVIDRDAPDAIFCKGVLSELRGELIPFYDSEKLARVQALGGGVRITRDTPAAFAAAQLLEPQCAGKVIRAGLIRDHGLMFPNTHFFEDIFFHTDVLAHAQVISTLHQPSFTYFRRYHRGQITGTTSDRRMDIIPVTKLTLERFAATPRFADPVHRSNVIASCFKFIAWCETSSAHHHRAMFRDGVRALLRMIDPLWLNFPAPATDEPPELTAARAYIAEVADV